MKSHPDKKEGHPGTKPIIRNKPAKIKLIPAANR